MTEWCRHLLLAVQHDTRRLYPPLTCKRCDDAYWSSKVLKVEMTVKFDSDKFSRSSPTITLCVVSNMPHCPQCSRKFKDNKSVLFHLNQPLGSCHSRSEEFFTIADHVKEFERWKAARKTPPSQNRDQPPGRRIPVAVQEEIPMEIDNEDLNMPDTPNTSPTIEEYQGAAQIFGRGETFMDKFDGDTHALKRLENTFYPFASRDEWELGSFLLRSQLSIASINKFLSLKIVSTIISYLTRLLLFSLDQDIGSILSYCTTTPGARRNASHRTRVEI